MIYAKCIEESQIAKSKEEFIIRQDETRHVYCEGEITNSYNGADILYCVPLNYIYDCLNFGNYIAIIDVESEDENYPLNSSRLSVELSMTKQLVLKIMKADSKEAIDYVFENVKNREIIHDGYKSFLSNDLAEYFMKKKNGVIE